MFMSSFCPASPWYPRRFIYPSAHNISVSQPIPIPVLPSYMHFSDAVFSKPGLVVLCVSPNIIIYYSIVFVIAVAAHKYDHQGVHLPYVLCRSIGHDPLAYLVFRAMEAHTNTVMVGKSLKGALTAYPLTASLSRGAPFLGYDKRLAS